MTRSGYRFLGWYDNADFAGEAVTEITAEDLGDKEFFAKWKVAFVVIDPIEEEPDPIIPDNPVDDCQKGDDCPAGIFTDLDLSEWYHDGIHFCVEESLMNGTSATTFEPATITSRAMIVTILYRLAGSPAVDADNPFADIEEGMWYTDAVIWAAENGIVSGYGNGKFGPNDAITREQTAKILYSYAAFAGKDVSVDADDVFAGFGDADAISVWAKDAMLWAVDSGLINGKTGNLLDPKGEASRAEAATMIYRFCELMK